MAVSNVPEIHKSQECALSLVWTDAWVGFISWQKEKAKKGEAMNIKIQITDDHNVSIVTDQKRNRPAPKSVLRKTRIGFHEIRYAQVGDYFMTEMKNGDTVRFDCVYCDDNIVRFDSNDCVLKSCWNKTDTNEGGYVDSELKRVVDNYTELLPDELQDMIVNTVRRCNNGDDVTEFKTKLFVPDEGELFDDDGIYNKRIYEQLDYFKDRRNRMKGAAFGEDTVWYWTASAYSGASTDCVLVSYDGSSYIANASDALHVPVCFQINRAKHG